MCGRGGEKRVGVVVEEGDERKDITRRGEASGMKCERGKV